MLLIKSLTLLTGLRALKFTLSAPTLKSKEMTQIDWALLSHKILALQSVDGNEIGEAVLEHVLLHFSRLQLIDIRLDDCGLDHGIILRLVDAAAKNKQLLFPCLDITNTPGADIPGVRELLRTFKSHLPYRRYFYQLTALRAKLGRALRNEVATAIFAEYIYGL